MERAEQIAAWIGFGEAAEAFASGHPNAPRFRAYDRKTDSPAIRPGKLADYARAAVHGGTDVEEAVADASTIVSLVTADQALNAARAVAPHIPQGSFYFDGNSVAPETKREAAGLIKAAGGHYIDMAIMAPVNPQRLAVPLLLSGPRAGDGLARLEALGFSRVRVAGEHVGRASSIKMIRSVMVKGIEALSAECAAAARAAGVFDEVMASLDASERMMPWSSRVDYNLERMARHGLRRAAEMEQVVATLDGLGTGSRMSRATVQSQRAAGEAADQPEQRKIA